ncbi:hypothetical protein DBR06_SOUSAS8110051, partial [Sousa chinensis]
VFQFHKKLASTGQPHENPAGKISCNKCKNSTNQPQPSPDSTERFLDPLQLTAERLTECLKLEETNWMFYYKSMLYVQVQRPVLIELGREKKRMRYLATRIQSNVSFAIAQNYIHMVFMVAKKYVGPKEAQRLVKKKEIPNSGKSRERKQSKENAAFTVVVYLCPPPLPPKHVPPTSWKTQWTWAWTLRSQSYRFGCQLKADKDYHFKVDNDENEHQLSLRTISLGAGAKDELHTVEAEAVNYEGSPVKVTLATLKMSQVSTEKKVKLAADEEEEDDDVDFGNEEAKEKSSSNEIYRKYSSQKCIKIKPEWKKLETFNTESKEPSSIEDIKAKMQTNIEKDCSLPKVEAKFISYVKNSFQMTDQESIQDLFSGSGGSLFKK